MGRDPALCVTVFFKNHPLRIIEPIIRHLQRRQLHHEAARLAALRVEEHGKRSVEMGRQAARKGFGLGMKMGQVGALHCFHPTPSYSTLLFRFPLELPFALY